MNLPLTPKPFPIPVVSAAGAGSLTEDETLDYLRMPAGMDTYRPPRLPEPEELVGHDTAVQALHQVLGALQARVRGETPLPISLSGPARGGPGPDQPGAGRR